MANRIKKGDQVVINTGKDKGKQGEVVCVDGDRVIVSNANVIKRHTKPNPQAGVAGGVVEREASIHISNVNIVNPATGKGERVGFKVLEDGRKLRVFRSSGEALDA
ncbi:50S ribosomal protein L24 [Xanthomonas oryzae]|uniref:Large ribosomal subunit protein uL24 n=1 Tax=Xanthomonas oryzae pv. oryzicola (strain BLS256) TaxID=383407 RepID=G7TF74_XANOB|nr:50S ribosomal protein L24 [Xanthomonas oryzae]AEQ95242.1 ribosomal protein L24 [Xanthomonas oryzae pv. oryzicola BLS256]AKO18849.1 50S ribosomal protein L24 [Xanthomonas oryzae pv. oryzicola]PUE98001.1 50S ribosomal protein L24 [Xanthomonas oryzae pv. oryzicola]WVN05873.1 50S ribosomal protein L24 [Xanthomonas oryzae pv. oryzicola]